VFAPLTDIADAQNKKDAGQIIGYISNVNHGVTGLFRIEKVELEGWEL
jgi:hypothetical protein